MLLTLIPFRCMITLVVVLLLLLLQLLLVALWG
jgi:hypothetical protein